MTTAKQVNHVRRFKALRSGGQYLKDFPQATVRRETQSSSLADRPKVSDRRPTPKREGGGLPVMKDRKNDKVKTADGKQKWTSRKPAKGDTKGGRPKTTPCAQSKVTRDPEVVNSDEITRSGNGVTWSMIVDEQNKCDDIKKVIELLPQKETLDNVDEWGMGVVQLWTQRKSLYMYKDVLHRHYVTPQGVLRFQQILVPRTLREKFLYWVHDDKTSGHLKAQKTSEKLIQYAYWPGWRSDVIAYVRRCDACCRVKKGPSKPQGVMRNGVGLAPFQKFHIDLTGPHRRSSGVIPT
jgi:hypothetical protein